MRTRRSVLVGVGGLITLTGCSQQSGQPAEESDAEGASGEFGIDQFRVGGENPDEYEAEFIAGSNASEVADELTPEVSYRISGAGGEVETQVRYEYSDATIPEGEPLDETVEGETHEGGGEYAQAPSMPDELVSEILQNPKNLVATFRATDMESEVTETQEYELNFADSFGEQIITEAFSQLEYNGELEKTNVDNGTIEISYNSKNSMDTQEFERELGGIAGLYSGIVEDTRVSYDLELTIKDNEGKTYRRNITDELSSEYLNGNISEDEMSMKVTFDKLIS